MFSWREAIAPTAVGDGIAIPHVRKPLGMNVRRPMLALCFLERPIEYGALDGKPVGALFTIISPTTRAHLQLMSKLSFVLRDPGVRRVISEQSPRREILLEIGRAEQQLASPESGGAARRRLAHRARCQPQRRDKHEASVAIIEKSHPRRSTVFRVAQANPLPAGRPPMELTIRDAAAIFGVPEGRIYRWVHDDDLPARNVNGQLYFNRTELLEWATIRRVKFASDLFRHPSAGPADRRGAGGGDPKWRNHHRAPRL